MPSKVSKSKDNKLICDFRFDIAHCSQMVTLNDIMFMSNVTLLTKQN